MRDDLFVDLLPISEAEGGNPMAEILREIRVIRTTPDSSRFQKVRQDDRILSQTPGSPLLQDLWRFVHYKFRHLKRLRKMLREKTTTESQKLEYVHMVEDACARLALGVSWYHCVCLVELKDSDWNGRTPVTFRKGGIMVITATDQAKYTAEKERYKTRMMAGDFCPTIMLEVLDVMGVVKHTPSSL